MDQKERQNDLEEALRMLVEGALAESWHALPAVVQSFNPQNNTIVAQPTIKVTVRQSNGQVTLHDWTTTPLLDVPVVFPGGGGNNGWLVTFPLKQGDEVLVIFADRCIDSWWQSGGVQQQAESRFHSLSDGFAIPGPRSKPNIPTNISTTSLQIRSFDGTCLFEMASGGVINIKAPGGVNLTGALVATGELTAKSTHTVSAHIHSDPQGGNTGGPTG